MKHDNPVVVDIVDQHDVFQKQFIKRRRFYMKCKYEINTTTNKRYLKSNVDFDILFKPGEKATKYKKKISNSDKLKKGHGKCMVSFNKYLNKKLPNDL